MANLNTRSSVDPRFINWAKRTLEGFAVCTVAIYDPDGPGAPSFDPFSGPASEAMTKLWEGTAQVQVYRQVLTADDVAGSVAQVRSVRMEIPRNEPSAPIRKGLIARVVRCDFNPSLTQYEYVVSSGLTSGLAWTRNIECEVNMAVVAPPIEVE